MANGGQPHGHGARQNNNEPKPTPVHHQEEPGSKRDLASWWRSFKSKPRQREEVKEQPQGIFGVPLQTSIRYANVAISLFNDDGESYIYGYVPIVVAKCGVFLKEKATDVEGIFRLAGSEKRIKELKTSFDSPDRYGKGLDWTGYTVHDAANILRRYFNHLPEPIIPLEFYERFREPIRHHQAQAVGPMDQQAPSQGTFDPNAAIESYKRLITELPPLNRQLLLYILDLLAVFASKSDVNKMTTPNLAAIFQPGTLSHPNHDMSPPDYRLSQDVLIFLIENQDSFLIGMKGTAADEETVRDVQSGGQQRNAAAATTAATTAARNNKSGVARSNSNASAGADSVRKYGGLRRNLSVSSRGSKQSMGAPSPVSPSFGAGPGSTGSGVHRSNTVPAKRSPVTSSPRFTPHKSSEPSTPPSNQLTPSTTTMPPLPLPTDENARSRSGSKSRFAPEIVTPEEEKKPANPIQNETSASNIPSSPAIQPPTPSPSDFQPSPVTTPSGTNAPRGFPNLFKASPGSDSEKRMDGRKPNKLQKKRLTGMDVSANSSSHSLHDDPSFVAASATGSTQGLLHNDGAKDEQGHPIELAHRGTDPASLKPSVSPAGSLHTRSTATDLEEREAHPTETTLRDLEAEEKKHRWRLKSPVKKEHDHTTTNPQAMSAVSTSPPDGERSRGDPSDGEDRERRGPIDWLRSKRKDRKEKEEAKNRAKTPERHPSAVSEDAPPKPQPTSTTTSITTTATAATAATAASAAVTAPETQGRGRSTELPRAAAAESQQQQHHPPPVATTSHARPNIPASLIPGSPPAVSKPPAAIPAATSAPAPAAAAAASTSTPAPASTAVHDAAIAAADPIDPKSPDAPVPAAAASTATADTKLTSPEAAPTEAATGAGATQPEVTSPTVTTPGSAVTAQEHQITPPTSDATPGAS